MNRQRLSLTLLAVCVTLTLVPASASATDFSIFASYFDTDDYDEAVGFGVRAAFFDNIQLEIGASYYEEFGRDIDLDIGNGNIVFDETLLDLDVIPVEIGARFNFGTTYLGAGGTYYILDSDAGSVDDEFGLYARFGVQFSNFFAEVGYRDVEGSVENLDLDDIDDVDFVEGIADFDLTGFFVNVGWRF